MPKAHFPGTEAWVVGGLGKLWNLGLLDCISCILKHELVYLNTTLISLNFKAPLHSVQLHAVYFTCLDWKDLLWMSSCHTSNVVNKSPCLHVPQLLDCCLKNHCVLDPWSPPSTWTGKQKSLRKVLRIQASLLFFMNLRLVFCSITLYVKFGVIFKEKHAVSSCAIGSEFCQLLALIENPGHHCRCRYCQYHHQTSSSLSSSPLPSSALFNSE